MLLFATGLALSDILTAAFFAWVVVVTGLVGALTQSSYKWGFFVFGLFALFHIWYAFIHISLAPLCLHTIAFRGVVLGHGPRTNFNGGAGHRTGYMRGSGFLVFITLLYPICWALSEGGNVISPTSEAVWYGILDLLLGPVFLFYFIFSLRKLDYNTFGFQSWKHSDSGAALPAAVGAGTGYGAGRGVGTTGTAPGNAKAAEAGMPATAPVTNSGAAATSVPMSNNAAHAV